MISLFRWRSVAGFTLIEMVVVVGLMGLLLGGSIVGYRKFNDRQLVIQAGKEFISVLRTAQKRASVGDKPDVVGCNGGQTLDGYRVQALSDESTYTLSAVCDGSSVSTQSYSIASAVIFKQNVDVQFQVLSRGVIFGAGGSSVTLQMGTAQSPGYLYTVQVTRSGEIYEQGISSF